MAKMRLARVARLFLLLTLLLAIPGWGRAQDVQQLQITLQQRSAPTSFVVAFHNGGAKPLSLLLGILLGNGASYPTQVTFTLIDSSGHTSLLKRKVGQIAGSVSPMATILGPGKTFTLPIDLNDYADQKGEPALAPGDYTLQALYECVDDPADPGSVVVIHHEGKLSAGVPMKGYWQGKLASERIKFLLPK